MFSIFKKKKWELKLIDDWKPDAISSFEELQKEGWELAGGITTYIMPQFQNADRRYMSIPIKREIKR